MNDHINDQLQVIEHAQTTAIDLAIRFGPRLVVALLILFAGWIVGRWVGKGVARVLTKLQLDETVALLLVRLVRLLVLGLFAIMALQNLGIELLPLIAGLGVAGAGIALAMQGVLGNLAAGLTIIFTRPFRVGEYISIVNEEGQVAEIKLFNTVLTHPDRSLIVIPNRKIVGEVLHNYGTLRQLDLRVGVAYDTDMAAAIDAIHTVLNTCVGVLADPAPIVSVIALGASGVEIAVRPWVVPADYQGAGSTLNQSILAAFHAHNIQIPLVQREVHLIGNPHP
jgi:small conductance mechanosensitive channel